MTIQSLADLDAAYRWRMPIINASLVNNATSAWRTLQFVGSGSLPPITPFVAPAAIGSGGSILTNASPGFPSFDASGDSYLAGAEAYFISGALAAHCAIYDMVWGASGVVGDVATAQAVTGFPTLTRPGPNGEDLEPFLVVTSAPGTGGSVTVAIDYTNSASVAGRTASLLLGAQAFTSTGTHPFKLQDGDRGVSSIQSITFSAAGPAPGTCFLMLGRRLAGFNVGGGLKGQRNDAFAMGLPHLADAALAFVFTVGNVSSPNLAIDFTIAKG